MQNETCKKNLSKEEIFMEFGKDDNGMSECKKCPNLTYEDGIMTCELLKKEGI